MKRYIQIGNRRVGPGYPTYVIAEAGSNHDQDYDQAIAMIDVAKSCGADAIKFQMFRAKSLYHEKHPVFPLLKSLELKPEWLKKLRSYCIKKKITFLVTPFEEESVDLLHQLDIPAFKWASSETVKLPLLRYAALKKRPLLISTGMCNLADVFEAIEVVKNAGNNQIILMQCTSLYPTPPNKVHLRAMDTLANAFHLPVGFSDHTLDSTAAIAAVARGACIIEKHFTLNRELKGPDHSYAMEPPELKRYIQAIRDVAQCLGSPEKVMLREEAVAARRESYFAKKTIRRGAKITEKSVTIQRPGTGIEPRFGQALLHKRSKKMIRKGDPISWEHI